MILCSGCFDGLHAGHVRYLKAAAALKRDGEELRVAVASDDYIRLHKKREPRWSVSDRMETVLALSMVDAVEAHNIAGAGGTIAARHPRLFVKGTDWRGRMPLSVQLDCRIVGADIVFVDTPGVHTSEAFS